MKINTELNSGALGEMEIRSIRPEDDEAIAKIVRTNLERYELNIPGTAYFDEALDHLSNYYNMNPQKRRYLILTADEKVIGGVGLAEFDGFDNCAELQKLYLADEYKGRGLGRFLFENIEKNAKEMGYEMVYLETHSNLDIAIGLYDRSGYTLIEKPDFVVHSTMDRFYIKKL